MAKQPELQLLTIGISHYCEKARWALQRSTSSFEETTYFPGLHLLFVKKLGGGSTLPKLIVRDGEERKVLHHSADILAFSDTLVQAEEDRLYPADRRETVRLWEEEFDNVLGPQARKWAYCYLAYHKSLYGLLSQGSSIFQKTVGFLFLPLLRKVLYQTHGCDQPNAKNVALGKIVAVFDKVNEALRDGRAYICGETFTAADLTFSALAGPVLLPPGYGCHLLQVEECPHEMGESIKRFRESAAGKHVLGLYKTHRHKKMY